MRDDRVEVAVRPSGAVFRRDPGDVLLQALRENDQPISFSCEDGRCGLCCCRITSGRIIESARPPRQLSNTRSPYVLACQSSLVDDCVVEIPEPDEVVVHRPRKLRARVLAIESLAPDVRRLRLSVPRGFTYSPGQFVEMTFAPGLVRTYSVAGARNGCELDFHVQIHPFGRGSAYVNEHLQPGDHVRVEGPLGSAYLRQKNSDPIICVAAKTGVAPLLSVLRAMGEAGIDNPVHVYIGFMSNKELYAREEIETTLARLPSLEAAHWLVATGPHDDDVRRGLLTNAIDQDFGHLAGWRGYVYGSPFAAEATARLLHAKGMAPEYIYADPFQVTGD